MTADQLVWRDEADVEQTVTVTALDPVAFAELVDRHPPGPADPAGLPWSEETFPPALIAASTGWSPAFTRTWWDEETPDLTDELLAKCLAASAPGHDFTWAVRRLEHDPRLLLEMEYCGPRGLPHDAFLLWSRRSQDLALAQLVRSRDRCPGCGVPTAAMDDPTAADIELKTCVHCEYRSRLIDTIPEAERYRVHAFLTPPKPDDSEG